MAEKAEKPSGAAKPIRISDVAKPGKSAPSASSKPILVTNRPVLRDPMMVNDESEETGKSGPALPLNHLKIAPLTDNAHADSDHKKTAEVSESETDAGTEEAEAAAPDTDAKGATESETNAATTEPATNDDEPTDDASTDTAKESNLTVADDPTKSVASQQKAEADLLAAEQRAKELDEMAESRKYYLPINQVEKRKAKRYAWAGILLIILLAVAWADVAADAGLITLPVKPVTHFFSN